MQSHDNMQSALINPKLVEEYLEAEVQAGRIVWPLDMPYVKSSRFGVIPNHNQPGKLQLSLDLSSPHNHSVNDGIMRALYSVKYATIDQAVTSILDWVETPC